MTTVTDKTVYVDISHSPFMSWLNGLLSMRALSEVIGTTEILAAVLIVLHAVSPRLGVLGGALGILLFLSTLSFCSPRRVSAILQRADFRRSRRSGSS